MSDKPTGERLDLARAYNALDLLDHLARTINDGELLLGYRTRIAATLDLVDTKLGRT